MLLLLSDFCLRGFVVCAGDGWWLGSISTLEIWNSVTSLVSIFGGAIILFIGWFLGRWRGSLAWKKKEFKNRVVATLNILTPVEVSGTGGEKTTQRKLKLRTLFERDLQQVMQNTTLAELTMAAIDRMSNKEDPMVRFDPQDSWYVLNAILNQIAELFAEGTVRQAMGRSSDCRLYTFCLTYEMDGELRMLKPRAMLIEKEQLKNLPEAGEILLESPKHSTRVHTLRVMKKELATNPHLFMDIELCV